MFTISLSSCSRYNANFKLGQSVFPIHHSPLYYDISQDDHTSNKAREPTRSIIDELSTSLMLCFRQGKIGRRNEYHRPGLTPGMALRAVGSGIKEKLFF
jgi:hypothetical protein